MGVGCTVLPVYENGQIFGVKIIIGDSLSILASNDGIFIVGPGEFIYGDQTAIDRIITAPITANPETPFASLPET